MSIISVTETSGGVRRLLAPSVEVKSEIQTSDVSSVSKVLTADTLNKHLGDAGLPKATGIKVRQGGREGGREGEIMYRYKHTYIHIAHTQTCARARAFARTHTNTDTGQCPRPTTGRYTYIACGRERHKGLSPPLDYRRCGWRRCILSGGGGIATVEVPGHAAQEQEAFAAACHHFPPCGSSGNCLQSPCGLLLRHGRSKHTTPTM